MASYEDWAREVLGAPLLSSLHHVKIASAYPENSPWFRKAYEALLKVEQEAVDELIDGLGKVTGDFVEFGIFQGDWINGLYHSTERAGLKKNIWGFDSFEGLSKPHPEHDIPFWEEGMYAASLDKVRANVQAAERPRIKLVKGFFSDSLIKAEAQGIKSFCFARIDCDIYEPAVECLTYLGSRLSHNSILVFDDWTHGIEFGEGRAFAEWIPTVPHLKFETIFQGPWDHLYLRVLHR